MSQNGKFSLLRSRRHERGQVIIWLVMVWVVFFVLMGAVVADLGVVYCAYRQLQASTDAAALAGGAMMPTSTAAVVTSTAQQYSSYAAGYNVYHDMTVTTPPTIALGCSSTEAALPWGVICVDPSNSNVLTVTQTATVPLNFLNFFSAQLNGHPSMPITATSEAVMKGAPGPPYNVAIIVDTTQSMNSGTNSCGASYTPIQCARQGLQLLLTELQPCIPGVVPCGSTSPIDLVSLFVFPAWSGSAGGSPSGGTVATAWSGGTAHGELYDEALGGGPDNFPAAPGSETVTVGGTPITYQITLFSNDYQLYDGAGLNPASHIVLAAGYPYPSNNGHLSAPGGAGTYYAGVIYAAQNALAYQKSLNPLSNNVMIILTDGDAPGSTGGVSSACGDMTSPYNVYYTTTNPPSGCATPNNTTSFNSPNFMSATDECQEAIQAAWDATNQGTQVYTIGFASEASGCSSDTINLGLSSNVYPAGVPWPLTPCDTIEYMASDPTHWYSDSASQCSANGPTPQPAHTLATIIPSITNSISVARLITPGT